MANQKNFNTPKAPRMSQAFPQAVLTDHFIFVSGTPGLAPRRSCPFPRGS